MQYDVQLALVNSLLKRKLIKFNSMIIMTPSQNDKIMKILPLVLDSLRFKNTIQIKISKPSKYPVPWIFPALSIGWIVFIFFLQNIVNVYTILIQYFMEIKID